MATDVQDVLGSSVKRVEDPRFITGKGRYLDDIKLAGDGPHGHPAQPVRPRQHPLDRHVARPRRCPACVAVFVGADIPYNPLPMAWPAGGSVGHPEQRQHAAGPRHRQRQVDRRGRRRGRRRDARRRRSTRSRRSTSTTSRCRPSSTPRRRPSPARRSSTRTPRTTSSSSGRVGDKAGTDAAIDDAEVVVRQRIVNQRLIPNPMEVRGDIGWYNPGTDEYTVWMSSQTPHIQRLLLAAFVTGIPEHKIRCISPGRRRRVRLEDLLLRRHGARHVRQQAASAGGRSSGSRAAARATRPTIHGRDHITYLEIAGKRDGEVTGLRVKTFANLGGRLSTIGPGIPTTLYGRVLSGCYKIPNVYCEVTGVYTNTTFVDAYRGAGRPEATYVIERAMDLFADEIGMDRAEIRRQELHRRRTQFPYDNPSGLGTAVNGAKIYIDSGNYEPALDKALDDGRLRRPRGEAKAEAKSRGKLLGHRPLDLHRGLRRRAVEVDRRRRRGLGRRDVGVGQHQGPPDRQGRRHDGHPAAGPGPRDDLRADRRPRARHPDGGHRRPALGHAGHAVRLRLVRQPDVVGRQHRRDQGGRQDQREGPRATPPTCSRRRADDIEIVGAEYRVKGSPDKKKTIQEIAFALDLAFDPPEGMEPYLDETAYYDTPNCTWPFGTHIAIVEIDEETGDVDLVRYIAVDDVGKKINPMIVDGQLHGGIAQGVGQALWEGAVYGDDGQLLSGSMLDYALPRASWLPELRARRDGHPVAGQPARRQGRRRGRRDRQHGRRRQRRHRRARAARASATSTCRTRRRPCGARCRPRREARHDPGSVRLPAAGLARRGARPRRRRPATKVHRRRP